VDALGILRFVAGTLLLAFLPGYVWARVLLPALAPIEQVVLGIVISIAALVLLLYAGNIVFAVPVKPATAAIEALALTVGGLAVPLARRLRRRLDRLAS